MCDGLITLDAFSSMFVMTAHIQCLIPLSSANPSLSALFPSHHGMVHIHTLPSPHTLLPPSDRFSTLRGLAASANEGGTSSGENNLAFKCTRKRLIFETMHLDVEGGVGERRTTAGSSHTGTGVPDNGHAHMHLQGPSSSTPVFKAALASVEVKVEQELLPKSPITTTTTTIAKAPLEESYDSGGTGEGVSAAVAGIVEDSQAPKPRTKKPKKTVAFRSDRPDLYDF